MAVTATPITSTTLLEPNTIVTVKNKKGIVIKSEYGKDQFGMPIARNQILYTHISTNKYGNKYYWKPLLNQKPDFINYASIYVLSDTLDK